MWVLSLKHQWAIPASSAYKLRFQLPWSWHQNRTIWLRRPWLCHLSQTGAKNFDFSGNETPNNILFLLISVSPWFAHLRWTNQWAWSPVGIQEFREMVPPPNRELAKTLIFLAISRLYLFRWLVASASSIISSSSKSFNEDSLRTAKVATTLSSSPKDYKWLWFCSKQLGFSLKPSHQTDQLC